MKNLVILFLLSFTLTYTNGQSVSTRVTSSEIILHEAESKLARAINHYRESKGLEPIELSASLTKVAQLHARDLSENHKPGGRCNLHSWSKSSEWSSCCYTPDHKKAACMWDKPRELTSYKGDGYEIAFYSNYPYSSADEMVKDALDGWKKSKGHNDIIINNSRWKTAKWKAMGVGVHGEYMVVWFGELVDPSGKPTASIN